MDFNIETVGVQKVKDALRKMAEELDDIKRNPTYLDLDDKYRSLQAELIIQKAENEALRAQVLALQALAAKSSD
jgi:multidrug efflux pump subunit AcrA (membrane-fusion protein)